MFSVSKTYIVLMLAAVLFSACCYKEGLKTERATSKRIQSKTVFQKILNMNNDGDEIGDPLQFTKNTLKKCKHACAKLADCIGFTMDKHKKECAMKSTKGKDTDAENISLYWKKIKR